MHSDRIFIEAYDKDGKPVLGNIDGQASLCGFKDYTRSYAYKAVKTFPKEKLSLNGRVVEYRIVREDGTILEVIKKD